VPRYPSGNAPNLKSYADISRDVEHLTEALTESAAQQTATSEVLRIISSSPTNLPRVLETILESAARLCDAQLGAIFRHEDGLLIAVAVKTETGEMPDFWARPYSPTASSGIGRALATRQPVHIADIMDDEAYRAGDPHRMRTVEQLRARTCLWIPFVREEVVLGVAAIYRHRVRPFTEMQIALLKTFADQAVIAIENVRLFTELEARNRELTASSEILRTISSSPTEVQPVFDVIVENACRLCSGVFANVFRFDGEQLHLMAEYGFTADAVQYLRQRYPSIPTRASMAGRGILERAIVQCEDVMLDAEATASRGLSALLGFRALISIPLLKRGIPVGALTVARREPGSFPERHIGLLRNFADQAVIAIENVRLFTELQTTNKELTQAHAQVTEALEQQTATSEILRVISSSPTHVKPVFDAIVNSSKRLLDAAGAIVFRRIGDEIHLAAHTLHDDMRAEALTSAYPVPFAHMVSDNPPSTRAWVNGEVANIGDALSDPQWPARLRRPARALGIHGLLINRAHASGWGGPWCDHCHAS
jgi:two-component system NtrC family sensor kinase